MPIDTDVPRPEPMDIDTAPSLAVEFEELLLQRHCLELIDGIHHVQRTLCYGCQYDRPGQLDHVCLADWEDKVDRCLDASYENVKLEPLFENAKRELTRKYPYVNMAVLTVLADMVRSSRCSTKRDIKQRVLKLNLSIRYEFVNIWFLLFIMCMHKCLLEILPILVSGMNRSGHLLGYKQDAFSRDLSLANAECKLREGPYKQVMYGFVMQKLGELYRLEDLMWEQAIDMNPSGGKIG